MAAELRKGGCHLLGIIERGFEEDSADSTEVDFVEELPKVNSQDPGLATMAARVAKHAAPLNEAVDVSAGAVDLREVLGQRSLHVLDRFDRGIDRAWVIPRSASDFEALVA